MEGDRGGREKEGGEKRRDRRGVGVRGRGEGKEREEIEGKREKRH